MLNNKEALGLGFCGAIIFILLCSFNIDSQGLYYDEVHQAPAAFVLLGKDVNMHTGLKWHGIPLFTSPYIGAIKPTIYGLFLKLSNRPFTVESWRLLGISFVALGIFIFCVLTYKELGRVGTVLFFMFFLTDTTVILTSRHDWGATALALMFRLIWLGVWLRSELESPTLRHTFSLGAIVGLSMYQKLSSVVLIFPLLLVILINKLRRTRNHWIATAAGIIIGGLPLILINSWSFIALGSVYSLSTDILTNRDFIAHYCSFISRGIRQVSIYLSLGNGTFVRKWILGQEIAPTFELLETALISSILLTIIISGLLYRRRNLHMRSAMVMIFCYLTAWIGVMLLPAGTMVQHWIIGTPFQYLGIALFGLGSKKASLSFNMGGVKAIPNFFRFTIVMLLLNRLLPFVSTEISLIKGNASPPWDNSYSKMARFAADHQKDSLFIITYGDLRKLQIYCLSNGCDDLAYECYVKWPSQEMLRRIIEEGKKQNVYLIESWHWKTNSMSNAHLLRMAEEIQQIPELHEEPLEPELANLKRIKCVKYRYVPMQ